MGDTKHNGIILQDIIHNFFSFLFPHEHQPQHLNAGWDDTQTCLAGTRQAENAKVMAWVREKDLWNRADLLPCRCCWKWEDRPCS
jgi:hypothetical protein